MFQDGEFNWDGETQGLVLGVFAWGYMSSQVPAGMAAERWGGKLIFGLGVLLTGVFNVLTPLAARSSLSALLVVRVLTGMSEVGALSGCVLVFDVSEHCFAFYRESLFR